MRNIYIVALALFYALFVGFGIAAFYAAPQAPREVEQPKVFQAGPPPAEYYQTEEYREYRERERQFQADVQSFQDAMVPYNRNLFYIAAVAGVLIMIVAVFLPQAAGAIRPGLMLGGLFAVVYGTMRYFGDMNEVGRFVVVTIGLVVLLYLGYTRLRQAFSA